MKRILLPLSLFITGCSLFSLEEKDEPMQTSDLIEITSPTEGQVITSPLTVHGNARGYWFFEADAPLILVDWDGKILAQSYIKVMTENWMTEDFVPFEGTLTFELPETIPYKRGTLIFQKSNPSGLPQYDAGVEIPITFE